MARRRASPPLTERATASAKGNPPYIQGYNAQTVVNEQQIVIAAEISTNRADFSNLRPTVDTALEEPERARVAHKPMIAVADAGYWNEQHVDHVVAERDKGIVPIHRIANSRRGPRPPL